MGFCFLFACEGLLKLCPKVANSTSQIFVIVINLVFHNNKETVVYCLSSLLKSGHCLEMLLLVAIHFHTNQLSSVVELVREALGLSISVHSDSLNQMASLFAEELFTEEVVAKEAVALAIHPNVSALRKREEERVRILYFPILI